ncbi:MAG: biotin/lipoyl-binding protein [Massilibacteroides sp.]|nr:biotin/lipoyl-binding protein [Massilibacteroides sp.]MDD3061863.1 biotin/lipoyl-binding protein [Massilibacteroides sp.]MDD4116534.1 biotin/lipoyl-binding protein [Massilibacteroides sp.]MDD4660587.1 biotin/lipoyl-binding protein [Massilibacteroides sp.]
MKKYVVKIHGTEYAVKIKNVEGKTAQLTVNDVPYEVEIEGLTTNPTRVTTKTNIQQPVMQSEVPVTKPAPASGSAYPIKSPLPGVILDLVAREGDTVKPGQLLMVLEAMKMENNIESDRAGVIEKINFHKGDSVLEGDVLLTIK